MELTQQHLPRNGAASSFDAAALDIPFNPQHSDQDSNQFSTDQKKLTFIIIVVWTLVQMITLGKNLFIYRLLQEPANYTNLITKRAIPWLTAIVFIFIINTSSKYLIRSNIKLIQLPIIHFALAIIITFLMYVCSYYSVIWLGMSTFQNSSILKYFMVEIDRLFLIYLLISLTTTAHYYFHEIKTKEIALLHMQHAYQRSRIISLNNEVNPHMIFNTLNNIYTMIGENIDHAKLMIIDFANLLRKNLQHKDTIFTTVAEEKVFLKEYITLLNNHQFDRYRILMTIDQDVEEAKIPKMLLQPLVENAIKHSNIDEFPLHIFIAITRKKQHIQINVKNRWYKKSTSFDKIKMGIGTDNITNRLKVLYGNDFKFEVSNLDGFFNCLIEVPHQR